MTTQNKNVPALRFPEFNEEWTHSRIQKLIDDNFITSHLDGNHGSLYPKSSDFAAAGVPYITANDFISGQVDFNNCKHLPFEKAVKFKKGVAKDGDVLFAHNATVGPTALLNTDLDYVILSTTATYFRCDNKSLYNKFLRYYLSSDFFVVQYSSVMSQSTRNQVPITTQRKFKVTFPTLPEQQKIAAFLTAVDEKIQQLTKKKDLLEQYKKGVMQKIFNQEIRFKDDNGNDFADWEEKPLSDIGELKGGGTPSTKNSDYWTGDFYWISSADVIDGDIRFINFNRRINSDAIKNSATNLIPAKSVIIVSRVGVGKVAINEIPVCTSQDFQSLIPKKDNYIYLAYLMQLKAKQLLEFNQGTSIKGFVKSDLLELEINIPCVEEQTKIARFLSAIDDKINLVNQQLEKTKEYKKGLLQQMFI